MASSRRRCATVVSHAPGLFGGPSSSHLEAAEMKASCKASSARSNEPEIRISVAMIRPYSSRKTCSSVSRACDMQAKLYTFSRGSSAKIRGFALHQKSKESAEGAQYESQGQARAKRS